jgi:hypothetical protein
VLPAQKTWLLTLFKKTEKLAAVNSSIDGNNASFGVVKSRAKTQYQGNGPVILLSAWFRRARPSGKLLLAKMLTTFEASSDYKDWATFYRTISCVIRSTCVSQRSLVKGRPPAFSVIALRGPRCGPAAICGSDGSVGKIQA